MAENGGEPERMEGGAAMAGRHKQPVDLLLAKGKTHLTKADAERRRAEEAAVEGELREVAVPAYLFEWPELVARFDELACMLCELLPGSFGQPDADTLARYVVAEEAYELYTRRLFGALGAHDLNAYKELHMEQDRAFKQAHACAGVLGLTVTSRCKLVVPRSVDADDEEESEF